MSDLKIRNLRKVFEGLEIIKGVNLDIKDHEFVVFVGPSGCGKSTLLRLIAGLEEVTSGSIHLDDREITDLAPAKRDLAMVFQSYALYPHKTVRKNMSFALDLAGVEKDEIERKVNSAARILELDHLLDRKPKALSGGQRQRVAIGRAIVRQPKVFLFDEPLSNLDAALRVQMRLELARLHQELNATMIYVTHDQVEAMTLASKVVVLNGGRIEQVGSPLELYHYPVNQFVAGFIGTPKMNFLAGTVLICGGRDARIELAIGGMLTISSENLGPLDIGMEVNVGVRPEHLSIVAESEGDFTARVQVAEHLGSDTYCYVKPEKGDLLTVRETGNFDNDRGNTIGVKIDVARCHIFDEQGRSCFVRKQSKAA